MAPFALGVLVTMAAAGLYGALVPGPRPLSQSDVNRSISSALASVTPEPVLSQLVYQAVAPSLVLIKVQVEEPSVSPDASGATAGPTVTHVVLGSGVIIDDSGDIMTCLHVVAGASSIQVTFADGTQSSAQIATQQPETDIAVLQASQLPDTVVPAVLGNPRSVQVGSQAFVLGSPFGLSGTMTSGIVSGLNRSFQLPDGTVLTGLIQVDAAVNPGNSGGPLINRNGQVVGIVDALVNPTHQDFFIGIGLAVPIDVAGGAAGLPQY